MYDEISDVTCVDCEKSFVQNSVQVYLEVHNSESSLDDSFVDVEDLCQGIIHKHNLKCEAIFFLRSPIFSKYTENSKIARYLLRDDILEHKLDDYILKYKKINNNTQHILTEEESEQCERCFVEPQIAPLHATNFDPIREWVLDVPLLLQVQLFQLVNRKCEQKSRKKTEFLKSKVDRLYSIYENMLKISNKKFTGLAQQVNTKKLIMGYKSVSTVFDVTSKQGVTLSLPAAERQLKKQAQANESYCNTYLKQHDMTYTTDAGLVTKPVRLRDCYNILLMDNLVRLKYTDDPKPGECRTKQLNTLPITLQGLPKDSSEVHTWHETEVCDGTTACLCKTNKSLTPSDVNPSLLLTTECEKAVFDKYNRLCTWNQPHYWQKVCKSESWPIMLEEVES